MNIKSCCGCEACGNACPVNAIKMVQNKEGFLYPRIDKSKCIDCGLCEKVCPVSEKNKINETNEASEKHRLYFGAKAKDDVLRLGSSSGGVFPVLALNVIKNGGVVFGACLDESGEVKHIEASRAEELDRLRKTKYVQSAIRDSFKRVKELCECDVPVLFVGTPCQCRGLQLFLGKEYKTLIVADLICYGVPSPGIWKDYLNFLKKRHGSLPENFSFRDKRNRDNGHTVSYLAGGREYAGELNSDPFCKSYFRNEIIRPSCHSCGFCTPDRTSDITIGDFWGIEKCDPEFDDGMGNSVVIIHSEKGRELWESVSDELKSFSCSREDVLQPRLQTPTQPSKKRGLIMFLYRVLPLRIWISIVSLLRRLL